MYQYNKRRTGDISGFVVAWVFMLGMIVLFYLSKVAASFLLVLIPVCVIITGKLLEAIIDRFLSGRLSYVLQIVIVKVSLGAAAFVFMYRYPNSVNVNNASYFIFILVFLRICLKLTEFLDSKIVPFALSRAFIYLFEGIAIWGISRLIWNGGVWNIGAGFSFGSIVLFGYIMLFICMLLSLFELIKNQNLKALGIWFGKSPNVKLLFATCLGFILIDLRYHIAQKFPQQYEFVEWMAFGGILIFAFFVVYSKVSNAVDRSQYEELGMHAQSIVYYKGDELKNLTKYIDEFVIHGKKNNLLTYIVLAMEGLGITFKQSNYIIAPLVDYNDKYEPWLMFRSEIEMVDERNIKQRRMIVEKIVSDIKDYRR
jgi:hypothetical protein